MKKQDRLKVINDKHRPSSNRYLAAADKHPGTQFDRQIMIAQLHPFEGVNEVHLEEHMAFVLQITEAIKKPNPQFFHDFADALSEYKKHKPNPSQADRERQAIIWCRDFSKAKSKSVEIRDVIACLKRRKVKVTDSTRKRLRTFCDEMGITVKGDVGRPKGNRGQKAGKKV